MLMPSDRHFWMAGRPAFVPGILIMMFGRFSAFHRRRASAAVPSVSCASLGETSRLTKPSAPFVES